MDPSAMSQFRLRALIAETFGFSDERSWWSSICAEEAPAFMMAPRHHRRRRGFQLMQLPAASRAIPKLSLHCFKRFRAVDRDWGEHRIPVLCSAGPIPLLILRLGR